VSFHQEERGTKSGTVQVRSLDRVTRIVARIRVPAGDRVDFEESAQGHYLLSGRISIGGAEVAAGDRISVTINLRSWAFQTA